MPTTTRGAKAKGKASLPPQTPEKKGGRKKATSSKKKAPTHKKSKDHSEDLEYSSDEVEDFSDTDFSATETVSSSTSVGSWKRHKLAHYIDKQLIIVIESRGGILSFDKGKTQGLRDLLDSNSDLYGHLGDALQDKIGKRVHYFKKNPGQFARIRGNYNIPPPKLTVEQLRQQQLPSAKPAKKVSISEAVYVSDLDDESLVSVTPRKKESTPGKKATPSRRKETYREPIPEAYSDDEPPEDNMASKNKCKFIALCTVAYNDSMLALTSTLIFCDSLLLPRQLTERLM